MLQAFYHEKAVQVGDETLHLVINFAALDAAEQQIGRPFDEVLGELLSPLRSPPLGLQGKVVWALLRDRHSEISLDQVATVLFGPASAAVGLALGDLLAAAFPATDGKAKAKNPRKPRGVSSPSSSPGAPKV